MFVWKTATILAAIRQCLPEFYDELKYFQKAIGTNKEQKLLNKIYERAPATSIDYAVLEKVKNIVVIKATFLWDDVGSWLALERHFRKDILGNVKIGNCIIKDTENSIIVSDKDLIATMGIRDLIIVNSQDATLIIAKEKSPQLKELIKLISENPKVKKYL